MKINRLIPAAFLALLLSFSLTGFSQEKSEVNRPQLTFDKPNHKYGTVFVDEMPDTKLDIKFSNTGNEPLILSGVRACCGTRVTEWPREPIMPGEEGVIKIEFRLAPRAQRISRTVTASYNNPQQPTVVFRILGQIVDRE